QNIKMANAAFSSLTGLGDEHLIGASDSLPAFEVLLGNTAYIDFNSADQGAVTLERTSRSVSVNNGQNLQLHYFQVIQSENALQQENQRLKQQVERLTLTDELTGLANERALSQQLAIQVTRSRRYQNPLTLALLSMEIADDNNPHILDDNYDRLIVAFSQFLRDRLRWADFIARCSGGRFIVVLPETTEAEAAKLFENMASETASIGLSEAQKNSINMQFGLAAWQKGNDPKLLVERASMALNQSA
ncbi:MAG: GGDEF domain-containing protein, partial [Gammaproteobacteria bacterium]|nr:GGDEF domain-containing protein [Gammaproteobacteria bacterium]